RRVEAGDPDRTALWRAVSDALSAPAIADAFRAKLESGLRIRAKGSGEGWPLPMHPQPVLYADFDGYAIKPHAAPRYAAQGLDRAHLHAGGREPSRAWHDDLQDLADGRLPLAFLWPRQGQDRALPAQHRLRLRRHPPRPQSLAHELARARSDRGRQRETPHDDRQHLLRQTAQGGRGGAGVPVGSARPQGGGGPPRGAPATVEKGVVDYQGVEPKIRNPGRFRGGKGSSVEA